MAWLHKYCMNTPQLKLYWSISFKCPFCTVYLSHLYVVVVVFLTTANKVSLSKGVRSLPFFHGTVLAASIFVWTEWKARIDSLTVLLNVKIHPFIINNYKPGWTHFIQVQRFRTNCTFFLPVSPDGTLHQYGLQQRQTSVFQLWLKITVKCLQVAFVTVLICILFLFW